VSDLARIIGDYNDAWNRQDVDAICAAQQRKTRPIELPNRRSVL